LAAEFPTENWYRREIAFTLDCLGWLMQQTVKRPDRAEPFFRQALPYHARLAVEDPALAADERERLARDFRHLGDVLLEQGKHAEAAETAVEWARLLPNALETYRDAIFLLDRCASLVKEDAKLSDAERQVAASRYAERSEELTREAKKRGAGGDARFWRNRGDVYVNLRQWEKAAAAYTEVLALAPENAWLLHGLGMVQYRAGHFAPAIQALKHSLTLNGANAKDFLLLAMSHWQRGEKEQARQWYNAALLRKEYELRRWRWSAGEPTALLREADALMGTGRAAADPTTLDKPESYTRIIEAQPEAAWAYQLRGQLHRRLGNTQQADRDTRRAYDLLRRNLPTGPEALNGMGRAGSHYLESNNWDMAVIAFSKAIELKADEPWYYNERGMAYLVLEKYAEAATDYAKEIELNPNHAPLYARRGYAYLRCGERDKALADIAKALELNPEHERGWDSWSWDMAMMLCAELDQWKTLAARVAHWKAVETNGSNMSSLRYLHALASLAADDFAAYRSVCASMLEQFGRTDDAASAHWVAWTCALAPDAVTDWNQPVKLARFALQQKGTESDRHARTTALGALLCRAGRFADAIEALQEANGVWEKAAVKPPMSSPVYTWFFLAMAHHRLGHAEEARNWLDKANQFIEKQAKDPVNEPSQPWNRRMTHRLLRREAETLIHGADKKQREPAK
jgi:tetratricopeptide (TPR) repeat protein